jgi:hypothetical protein
MVMLAKVAKDNCKMACLVDGSITELDVWDM